MNSVTKLITISLFTLLLSGCFLFTPTEVEENELPPVSVDQESEEETEEAVDEPTEEGETSADAPSEPVELVAAATAAPQYTAYSEAKRQELLETQTPHVIFFHAEWCPTCRAFEDRLDETLSSYPNGTIILKANFDTEKELKKEYTVRSQSTLTVVKADGTKLVTLVDPTDEVLQAAISETLQ